MKQSRTAPTTVTRHLIRFAHVGLADTYHCVKRWVRHLPADPILQTKDTNMKISTAAAVFLFAAMHSQAFGAPTYVITKVETLGGATSVVNDINAAGIAVGHALTASGDLHAFVWESGVITDLGTLGGVESRAYEINDSGRVVGTSFPASPPANQSPYRATVWETNPSAPLLNLGTFGGTRSTAWSLNNLGQAVGGARELNQTLTLPFFWDGVNPILNIGTLPGGMLANAWRMNDTGFATGYSGYDGTSKTRAILWNLNDVNNIVRTDLGTLGGTSGDGYGINDLGYVVGFSTNVSEQLRPFLWSGSGPLVDLGTLGGTTGEAREINNSNWTVGVSRNSAGLNRATLWENGQIHDLTSLLSNNSEGWVLDAALNISDAGIIVGRGTVGGVQRGFILDPVPEPGSAALLLLGATALGLRRRRSA